MGKSAAREGKTGILENLELARTRGSEESGTPPGRRFSFFPEILEGALRLAHLFLFLFPHRVRHREIFTVVLYVTGAYPLGALEPTLPGDVMVEMVAVIAAVKGLAAPLANFPQSWLSSITHPWSLATMALLHFFFFSPVVDCDREGVGRSLLLIRHFLWLITAEFLYLLMIQVKALSGP